ncbi:GOLPH3/VPS74 family protein [Streptomyces griseoaurantiacus]|uniref:Golgi phosphoprotein 3 (GPP34) n=1 Tax=Streptomyces griseoaurantiacus TaxID=68213 RepID=A0A1G7IGN4_9ACTN|nr:GPP34 family phosphoprotein [Streptomyces jietaisiensis]SDF11867.1 Golgi phosphoprotein 3 (GPP34) [Streptomyces jietaisiensis]
MLHGSLSLPARLCLLSWDTATGEPLAADRLPYLVRAGALTELARRGPLTDVDGIVTPADLDARTGDDALDDFLELVMESRPRTWAEWVTAHASVTLDAVRAGLAADGRLRPGKRRALGFLPRVDYSPVDPGETAALQKAVRRALAAPSAARVPPEDAALAALATTAGALATPSGADLARAEELTRGAVAGEIRGGLAAAVEARARAA